MLTMEELLEKIKYRAIEKAVYTRNETEFRIKLEELPPIMPKVTANKSPVNTEHEKRSAFLKSSNYTSTCTCNSCTLFSLIVSGVAGIFSRVMQIFCAQL